MPGSHSSVSSMISSANWHSGKVSGFLCVGVCLFVCLVHDIECICHTACCLQTYSCRGRPQPVWLHTNPQMILPFVTYTCLGYHGLLHISFIIEQVNQPGNLGNLGNYGELDKSLHLLTPPNRKILIFILL